MQCKLPHTHTCAHTYTHAHRQTEIQYSWETRRLGGESSPTFRCPRLTHMTPPVIRFEPSTAGKCTISTVRVHATLAWVPPAASCSCWHRIIVVLEKTLESYIFFSRNLSNTLFSAWSHQSCSQFSYTYTPYFTLLFFISLHTHSPWYNHTGWHGVKHQVTYLLAHTYWQMFRVCFNKCDNTDYTKGR